MYRTLGSLLLASLAVAAVEDGWYHDTRELWAGIPITIRFTPADTGLADRIWSGMAAVDTIFNDYKDGSEIGRINAGGPGEYHLGTDLAEAFALSDRMRGVTGGAFEITVGPLRRLWRGAEKSGAWPSDEAIAGARAIVGPAGYTCQGSELRVTKPGIAFDFGGVCKGMAVDHAVALLQAAGCTAALVQVGGESCCWGTAPSGHRHRLGVPHPDDPDGRLWCRLEDPGQGMGGSTSGNYRNPIIIGGRECYHIYDPRSGLPTDTHVLSVSVAIAGTGHNGLADALTKAAVVLGPPGLGLIRNAGAEAMMLVRSADGGVTEHATPGWSRFRMPEAP